MPTGTVSLTQASLTQLLQTALKKLWAKGLIRLVVKFYGCAGLGVILSYLLAKKKDLAGKTVLITGGGAGLGRAMAFEFTSRGARRIILWDINNDALEATQRDLKKAHPQIEVLTSRVDISQRTAIYAAADELLAQVGFVDVVVNNAGILGGKPILEQEDKRIQMVFDVNAMALFWTTKKFLPSMMQRNDGHIIVISSLAGLFAAPMMVDYSASKFAAKGFTDALRMELGKLGKSGVKTLCVCPAAMQTALFKGFSIPGMPAMKPEYVAGKVVDYVQSYGEWLIVPYVLPSLGVINNSLLPVWVNDLFNKPVSNTMAHFDGTQANSVFNKMEESRNKAVA